MRLALQLSVAVLVVLAGCGGLTGPGPAETAETTAPAETADVRPAGLTADSVADARTLAMAHDDELDSASYTVDYQQTVRYENGTVLSRSNETHHVGEGGAAFYDRRVDGQNPIFLGGASGGIETWSNGSVVVSVVRTADSTTYERYDNRPERVRFDEVYKLLTVFDLQTTGRTGSGDDARFYLSATAPTETTAFGLEEPARNTTLELTVDADGVLRHSAVRYTSVYEGTTVQVTETMRVTDLGETAVPRPAWVDRALDETEPR